jgi:outer membrane lipoprotein-sorting protein
MFLVLFVFCLIIGCSKNDEKAFLKKVFSKVEKADSYHLDGVLEIYSDENAFLYDVDVSYLKDNNFRVSLKNQSNNHEQIILRNSEGVYVLTPSLNKSFKFQSEWPYNNSQSYLLHNLINDIKNDSNHSFSITDDGCIISTVVNYSNNKNLVSQKIYAKSDGNIYQVDVMDSYGNLKLKMSINSIDYDVNYDADYFNLEKNLTVSYEYNNSISKIDSIIYPMYIPQNTYLSSQDKVSLENGERVIMTFSGDYPFMFIQETIDSSDNSIISVSGDILQLADSIGIMDESSITWVCDGMEYYLVSNSLDSTQLIDVANSLTAAVSLK